jgi:hypothetical protein
MQDLHVPETTTAREVCLMIRLCHAVFALLLVVSMTTGATAGGRETHSGSLLAIDRGAGTIVLAEVGPWRLERGQTRITERSIIVTDATVFTRVRRAESTPTGFPGDFVQESLDRWDLRPGDWVTVECDHGRRMTAVKITVTAIDGR